jgi:nucleoside-diphosphate kinase
MLVKPDAVRRGLVGEVISRLERKGLELAAMRLLTLDPARAHQLYEVHSDQPFFADLVDFITSGPLVALAVRAEGAISLVRTLMGSTDPLEAAPGTIRGDFGFRVTENLVHGSDGPESAERELELFFPDLGSSS